MWRPSSWANNFHGGKSSREIAFGSVGATPPWSKRCEKTKTVGNKRKNTKSHRFRLSILRLRQTHRETKGAKIGNSQKPVEAVKRRSTCSPLFARDRFGGVRVASWRRWGRQCRPVFRSWRPGFGGACAVGRTWRAAGPRCARNSVSRKQAGRSRLLVPQ